MVVQVCGSTAAVAVTAARVDGIHGGVRHLLRQIPGCDISRFLAKSHLVHVYAAVPGQAVIADDLHRRPQFRKGREQSAIDVPQVHSSTNIAGMYRNDIRRVRNDPGLLVQKIHPFAVQEEGGPSVFFSLIFHHGTPQDGSEKIAFPVPIGRFLFQRGNIARFPVHLRFGSNGFGELRRWRGGASARQ